MSAASCAARPRIQGHRGERVTNKCGAGEGRELGAEPSGEFYSRFRTPGSARVSLIDIYLTPARNGALSNTNLEAWRQDAVSLRWAPDERTQVDRTTRRFLPGDVVQWADSRQFRCAACAIAGSAARRSRAPQERRERTGGLPTWALRHGAERIGSRGRSPRGGWRAAVNVRRDFLAADDLARAAFEAAPG